MKTRQAHPSENSPMYVGPRAPKVPVVEVREGEHPPQHWRVEDFGGIRVIGPLTQAEADAYDRYHPNASRPEPTR